MRVRLGEAIMPGPDSDSTGTCRTFWLLLMLVLSVSGLANAESGEGRGEVLDGELLLDSSLVQDAGSSFPAPLVQQAAYESSSLSRTKPLPDWLDSVQVGYDGGFLIASDQPGKLSAGESPFQMRINGWGQLRHTVSNTDVPGREIETNQFQLKRARLIFSGSAFTPDFDYFFQIDGRSSSGDNLRLLDYVLSFDFGHHLWDLERGTLGLKTGKYKMPVTMSRWLSGRELEFTDRSVASMYFDVNRSLGWGLFGQTRRGPMPLNWEFALFNGLVTGGAETGSSGALDNNFAYSGRVYGFPTGDWGEGSLADLDWHEELATRVGLGFAGSTIERFGTTEFSRVRVVDSGLRLSDLLDPLIDQYTVNIASLDCSIKYRGWSTTFEYYFRTVSGFHGREQSDLFDHGFWLQTGKFIVPGKLQLLTRWSRVVGNSGTLGRDNQSFDEVAGGFVWYIKDQHAKFTVDVTYLNGAPIDSAALDIVPGEDGFLFRSQVQFAF